jgi:hypothetical protein
MGSGGCIFEGGDGTEEGFELLARDSSGTEKDGIGSGQGEDGGLDADGAGASVQDEVDFGAEALADVVGGGRREFGEVVGAGGG